MITDEMLAQAAGEVSDAMIRSIAAPPHHFSPAFEKKLQALIRKAEHPVRHRVLRQAAAVLIALFTVFAALYLSSPTVRAAVNGWIRSTFGNYYQYTTSETTPPDALYDYYLPEEFEGYRLMDEIDKGNDKMFVYVGDDGQILLFEYLHGTTESSMFIGDIEDHQYISTYVGSFPADAYISPAGDESSMLIWHHPTENVLLCIQGCESIEQLITIAEKVKKSEKFSN